MPDLNPILATTVILPCLLALGACGTMLFSANNGFFSAMTVFASDASLTTLPGTDIPMKRVWTGIAGVDGQLNVLLVFFWQILDGRYPAATLQSVHFFGQWVAYWTIMILEGMREGNQHRLVAYTTLVGLLYQNISVAITIPAWSIIFLINRRPSSGTFSSLSVSQADARALPYSIVLGFILPTIAMFLPSPTLVTYSTQQTLTTLWQIFPVYIFISHRILRVLFKSPASTPATYHDLRRVHRFALLLAVTTHVSTLAFSVSTLRSPSPLHPTHVFLPKFSPRGMPEVGLAEGVLRFMQWDETASVLASAVWAGSVYLMHAGERGLGVGGVVLRAVGWSVVGGPAAACVALIWARDELLLANMPGNGATRKV